MGTCTFSNIFDTVQCTQQYTSRESVAGPQGASICEHICKPDSHTGPRNPLPWSLCVIYKTNIGSVARPSHQRADKNDDICHNLVCMIVAVCPGQDLIANALSR